MYLGIDYGRKRIGLAVGSQFPRGIGVLDNPGSFAVIAEKIHQICRDQEIDLIVMGLPTRMSGEKGELAVEIEKLGQLIEQKTSTRVVFEEEAFTSIEAEGELRSRGIDVRGDKKKIDELSAILILEQYINKLKIADNK